MTKNLEAALAEAHSALELIATPARSDGTYNRDRLACEQLARETLARVKLLMNPATVTAVTPVVASMNGSGKFVVHTDGGARPSNPGPSGWGAIVQEGGVVKFAGGGFIGIQTNQIAELVAAIEGLSRVPEGAVVELVSDSQYTLKGISEWRAGWERRGWVNSKGEPVANKEHWQKLFALVDKRKVTTRWVKGHAGDEMNERCDVLATRAIEARTALVLE
ncbi:ribonuclease HI [Paraburkholderia sp. A2RO-4L]|uniref:ribonuclease H family protein n=1 Tax=Paraburkholderia sp. A2RO-4L TaxID=3028374 RepID=UPI003DA7A718